MAGTIDYFSYGKRFSFLCIFSLFLPCNMAAVQNLYTRNGPTKKPRVACVHNKEVLFQSNKQNFCAWKTFQLHRFFFLKIFFLSAVVSEMKKNNVYVLLFFTHFIRKQSNH